MKLQRIICDCCGARFDSQALANMTWESKPSVFTTKFPRDGVNGGDWNMDVCGSCRRTLFDSIQAVIHTLQGRQESPRVEYERALERIANERNHVEGPNIAYIQAYRDGQEYLAKIAREALEIKP